MSDHPNIEKMRRAQQILRKNARLFALDIITHGIAILDEDGKRIDPEEFYTPPPPSPGADASRDTGEDDEKRA